MASFTTLLVITLLCLVIEPLKTFGLIGIGLLLYSHPLLTTSVLTLMGIAIYFINKHNRRNTHELPKLSD